MNHQVPAHLDRPQAHPPHHCRGVSHSLHMVHGAFWASRVCNPEAERFDHLLMNNLERLSRKRSSIVQISTHVPFLQNCVTFLASPSPRLQSRLSRTQHNNNHR